MAGIISFDEPMYITLTVGSCDASLVSIPTRKPSSLRIGLNLSSSETVTPFNIVYFLSMITIYNIIKHCQEKKGN